MVFPFTCARACTRHNQNVVSNAAGVVAAHIWDESVLMPPAFKYGLISDIHANYVAMRVALDYLQAAHVDKILCLGDLVGYGAEPQACIDAVRNQPNILTIAGNHDRQLIGDSDTHMRRTATEVLEWTAKQLSSEQMQFVKRLPKGLTVDELLVMVHASLVERDAYILTPQEISRNFVCMLNDFPKQRICFYGHTHVPMLIGTKTIVTALHETQTLQLDRDDIYFINPGSVGQPRDKCPLACFGVFDAAQWTMTFVRRPYDLRLAQKKIIESGLPEKFARRLAVGI